MKLSITSNNFTISVLQITLSDEIVTPESSSFEVACLATHFPSMPKLPVLGMFKDGKEVTNHTTSQIGKNLFLKFFYFSLFSR